MTSAHFTHTKRPVDLTAMPINPDWIVDGTPVARMVTLSRSADGTAGSLMWDCTRGVFDWHYDMDETLYVLEGGMTLDLGLPTERRVEAGDTVFFPAGAKARWHVDRYIRKLAFIRKPLPAPVATILAARRALRRRLSGLRQRGTTRPALEPVAGFTL